MKALPLIFPLRGILKGKRYTYKWTSLLVLLYICEGTVRFASDPAPSRWYALLELMLALTLYASVVITARMSRRAPAGQT